MKNVEKRYESRRASWLVRVLAIFGHHRALSLLAILIAAVVTTSSFAQRAGSLDPTFSGDGKLIDGFQYGFDGVHQVVIQQDGKLVAAGHSSGYLGLARYNGDGSLDISFAGSGKVTTPIPAFNAANPISVAIQPDGKIVAAGGYNVGSSGDVFTLVRYNPNGSLDTSFGNGGTTSTHSGYSYSLNLQPDGKVIVAGVNTIYRFDPNGSLDTSFGGGDGVATLPFLASSSVLQTDGKIVAAGYSRNLGSPNVDFAIARCNPDGSLDPTFDGDGVATTTIGDRDVFFSVAMQSDGKIVAAGISADSANSYSDFILVRYDPNGSLDTSFDSDGIVTTRTGYGQAKTVAIQSDGKILAGGYGADGQLDFVLVRYNTNGSLDTSFDGDGKVLISDPFIFIESVVIQSDSKIVAAGVGGDSSTGGDFALARFNANGSLDTGFDADGIVTTDFGVLAGNVLNATAIQQDGKIVAVGNAVARYNPDGSPDTTFGGGSGKAGLSFIGYSVAVQPDGKIVVAGTHDNGDGFFSSDAWLTRFNPDGSLDTSFDGDGSVVITEPEEQRYFNSVAVQPDGKIIAAGRYMFRFNANGSLDTTFDLDGNVSINAVKIQPDGKIVAAGYGSNGSNRDFALARFNPDGSPDTAFDSDGKVLTSILIDDYADSIAVQPDGKILVSGDSHEPLGPGFLALVRYNANGSVDTTFGRDGKVLEGSGGYRVWAAVQSDGKIVAATTTDAGADRGLDFRLTRFNANGSPDTTFANGGVVFVDFSGNGSNDVAHGMALDSQGRAIVVGESDEAFAIARLLLGGGSPTAFDFDGDSKADLAVRRPSDKTWYFLRTSAGYTGFEYGIAGDLMAPADFDGDGKTDVAVFRPSDGTWYIAGSSSGFYTESWGESGDLPVPADYDGDGRADPAVFRPSNGTWYMKRSSAGLLILQFGTAEDKPQIGDYDGDGKADLAVRRPSDNTWYFLRSTAGFTGFTWGVQGDVAAPADFDGDGKTDVAVFRPSTGVWYVAGSTSGFMTQSWGTQGDIPVAADYDGDARADFAVYRPSDTTWYLFRSAAGILITQFGETNDKPAQSAFGY